MRPYDAGVIYTFEKISRAKLRPRAIAEYISEGGDIFSHMVGGPGKLSPGQVRGAQKAARKIKKKKMFQEETTKRKFKSQLFKKPVPSVVPQKSGPPKTRMTSMLEKLRKPGDTGVSSVFTRAK